MTGHQKRRPVAKKLKCSIRCQIGDFIPKSSSAGTCHTTNAAAAANQQTTYTRQNGLPEDAVCSIYRAPDGTVWAGTLNQGLGRFKADHWHTFTTQDGLPSNTISVITGNAAGEVFVGTPDGLAELKNDHWATYFVRDGLPPGPIESLFLDDAGTLWIGTSKGISFLESGLVRVPTRAPESLFGEILGIAESSGWLWITTGNHVLRVKSLALRSDSFGGGDYREFGVTDGLPSAQGVKRSRSVVEDNRGQVWFSLNEGISVLDPSAFARPAVPVTIRMDGMLIDGKLITLGDHIRLPLRPAPFDFSVRRRVRVESGKRGISLPARRCRFGLERAHCIA
jgi:hypothetical protein